MRAYNYLDIDKDSTTLVIEKDGYSYEYFEPNKDILISCENWTEMDINNYMRNNEPVGEPEPIDSDEDED
jgi:hypothetical protein